MHKKILLDNIDEFVPYVNLNEKARRQNIKDKIFQEKLNDFVNAVDPEEEFSEPASRQKSRGRMSISR